MPKANKKKKKNHSSLGRFRHKLKKHYKDATYTVRLLDPPTIPGPIIRNRGDAKDPFPPGPLHPFRARVFQPGDLRYGEFAKTSPKYYLGNVHVGSGAMHRHRSKR